MPKQINKITNILKKINLIISALILNPITIIVLLLVNLKLGVAFLVVFFIFNYIISLVYKKAKLAQQINLILSNTEITDKEIENILSQYNSRIKNKIPNVTQQPKLQKRKKYLHIALNSDLGEAQKIISQLPQSDKILIEVGTPLIKIYGIKALLAIRTITSPETYIIADNKCTDLAAREVEMMAQAGANAVTCLGVAPIETINIFIDECEKFGIDAIIDMMNVQNPLNVLKKLKRLPKVVILHRGVDETEFSKEKQIPYYQIKQIKGNYDILVAVAGGDTIKEIQKAVLNDADIVVVWKNFYQTSEITTQLAEDFLNEIK
jgi:3-keto-L-gulonate-6-phosphate decarboxylase